MSHRTLSHAMIPPHVHTGIQCSNTSHEHLRVHYFCWWAIWRCRQPSCGFGPSPDISRYLTGDVGCTSLSPGPIGARTIFQRARLNISSLIATVWDSTRDSRCFMLNYLFNVARITHFMGVAVGYSSCPSHCQTWKASPWPYLAPSPPNLSSYHPT